MFDSNMPDKARAYISAIIGLGLPLFGYCLYHSFARPDYQWLYLAALTALASGFPIKIPVLRGKMHSLTITLGDLFIFVAILLFDPYVATVLALIEGVVSSLRVKTKRLYKHLFNWANLALVAFLVGQVFYRLEGATAPLNPGRLSSPERLLAEMLACALLYFLINTGMIALGMALVMQRPFAGLWRENFLWSSPANLANGSTAAFAFFHFSPSDFSIAVLAIPLVLVAYYVYRGNFFRRARVDSSNE